MSSYDLADWVSPHLNLSLSMSFYEIPDHAPATFSTKNGTIPKRKLPIPPSPPIAKSNVDGEIRRKARSLREEFPAIVRAISRPLTNWYDLYKYFDGVDLWCEGASFLYYVLNHIANENTVLDHELEESKQNEIRDWAKLWIEANLPRVLNVPAMQDLISAFTDDEKESIKGLDKKQLAQLRNALNLFRKEYDHLRPPVEENRLQIPQPIQGMRPGFQSQSYHPSQHPSFQRGQFMMHRGPPLIQQGPAMGGRQFPVIVDDPHHNQMMPSRLDPDHDGEATADRILVPPIPTMHPQAPPERCHQTFHNFMECQRNIAPFSPMSQQDPVDFHQDFNHDWERCQHADSYETARSGRGGRGNFAFNNVCAQNRNFQQVDRRIVTNISTPRSSPLRHVPFLNRVSEGPTPLYVHNSKRQSPSFDRDATPRANDRGTQHSGQRVFSDPSNGQPAFSNDARLWQPCDRQRANSKPQESTDDQRARPPFAGDPRACTRIRSPYQKSTCIYWYQGEVRPQCYEEQRSRTVYVSNFDRNDLECHDLTRLFEKYGPVEAISYLFASYPSRRGGPAFVVFVAESSVEPAIQGLNGYEITPGNKLTVNLPNPRSRSGSYSSQNEYEQNYPTNYSGPRDFQHRGFNRRSSFRNQSISYRPLTYTYGRGDHVRCSSNTAEDTKSLHTPLRGEFQAQSQLKQPFPMHVAVEPLKSSITEVLQHQAAMSRFSNPNQMPLGSIENHVHIRNISVSLDNEGGQIMSQGSYMRKENSPKKSSVKKTPSTSPKKDLFRPQASDHNQKGNGGKNRKKGNKHSTSSRPSRAPSPVKSSLEDMLLGAMTNEQKQGEYCSAFAITKANENISSTVDANQSKTDYLAIDTPKVVTVATVSSSDVEPESVQLNSPKTNTLPLSDIFLIVAEPINEQPATPSRKLEISETAQQSFFAPKMNSQPINEDNPAPVTSPMTEALEFAPVFSESKAQKSRPKKKKRKSTPKNDADQSGTSSASQDSSETRETSVMAESTEKVISALSSPNPSLTSGPSETCLCATNTPKSISDANNITTSSSVLESNQVNVQRSITNSNNSTSSTPTPKSAVNSGKKTYNIHAKKGSNSSTGSTSSMRKTDTISTKAGNSKDENSTPTAGENTRNLASPPAVNFDDTAQWPSLGAAKTPLSPVDDKSTAVLVLQPLVERKKNPNALIIPAVPLNMQRRRPSVDSMAWPIIKKCDVK